MCCVNAGRGLARSRPHPLRVGGDGQHLDALRPSQRLDGYCTASNVLRLSDDTDRNATGVINPPVVYTADTSNRFGWSNDDFW